MREKVILAITELAKGIKSVSFYPPSHPALSQAIRKIVSAFEEIPLPEKGLEIGVTRNALLFDGEPLLAGGKALADLNRELYHRRASKMIFLPGQKPDEIIAFLSILNRDMREIQDEGGLETLLMRSKVSRIWANRVDYEGLTEMLKAEAPEPEEETPEEELAVRAAELGLGFEEPGPEDLSIDALLKRIEAETDPSAYRDHVISLSKALFEEPADRRIEYASRAVSILLVHMEKPPGDSEEIAGLARMGIRELASDDLVLHYIRRLQERSLRSRSEAESVLVAFGERAVKPLLSALAEEADLLVRKSIVDVVVRIGRPALPALLDNLNDSRWYVVRNMITILGSIGLPDLAPHIAAALPHPDLRVKKEAIKALSKIPHPSAVAALGELCFFPEETVALTATAALSAKKEPEAVAFLYRRAVRRGLLYPHYRLAHEAIDSLRAIGSDEAVNALGEILRTRAVWETPSFRAMKSHALRSISRIAGERPREIVRKALDAPEEYLRVEAERALKKESG